MKTSEKKKTVAPKKRSPSPQSSSSESSSSSSESDSGSDSDDRRKRSSKKSSRVAKSSSSRKSRKHSSRRKESSRKRSKSSRKHKKSSRSSRKSRRKASVSSSSSSGSESDHGSASSSDEMKRTSSKPVRKESVSDVDEDERREAEKFKAAVQGARGDDDDDDDEVGPQPLMETEENANASMDYGKALLPGEGAAIAQFVQKNMRIPRRGEVGWNGPEIENLETLGYVMSGSRHARMNAIRIRKENQVYSAEEKRALALINFEEKQQRENAIMNDFKEMLTERLTKKHGARLVEDMETSTKAKE